MFGNLVVRYVSEGTSYRYPGCGRGRRQGPHIVFDYGELKDYPHAKPMIVTLADFLAFLKKHPHLTSIITTLRLVARRYIEQDSKLAEECLRWSDGSDVALSTDHIHACVVRRETFLGVLELLSNLRELELVNFCLQDNLSDHATPVDSAGIGSVSIPAVQLEIGGVDHRFYDPTHLVHLLKILATDQVHFICDMPRIWR